MFTQWQQVESWIRDNGLNSWRFSYDRTGTQTDGETTSQTRSNRIAVLSDAFPGDLDEKIALTKRRLVAESNQTLYGYGKRGKENTGLLYCEVRLVDEFQQPGAQAVSSVPVHQPIDESALAERIRKEVKQEMELQRYMDERKAFDDRVREFEQKQNGVMGLLVEYLSPVVSAMAHKNVAGVDATHPVTAKPVQQIQTETEIGAEDMNEIFTEKESDDLFDLTARFKSVEPQYMQLIERVVTMAESGDNMYHMARKMLLG